MKSVAVIIVGIVFIVLFVGQTLPSTPTNISPSITDDSTIGAIPSNNGSYSVVGTPTISVSFINRVLAVYASPARGQGQSLYALGQQYGIDPIYALAFFGHESRFGTTGEARRTLSLGNERCVQDRPCIDQARGGYAQMWSWEDGFEHWYQLIRYGYVQGHVTIPLVGHACSTVSQIIPVYAPSTDHNNVAAYITSIKNEVNTWRAGRI